MSFFIQKYDSPLGPMTMASDGNALTGLWFDGQKYGRAGIPENAEEKELPVFADTRAWLDAYFSGRMPEQTPQLSISGSGFRKLVSEILLSIPCGSTMTYKQIAALCAARLGKKSMSAQAVGGAVGRNTISLIIPCHRVVGTDGSLTGYAGGLERKKWLLEFEKSHVSGPDGSL